MEEIPNVTRPKAPEGGFTTACRRDVSVWGGRPARLLSAQNALHTTNRPWSRSIQHSFAGMVTRRTPSWANSFTGIVLSAGLGTTSFIPTMIYSPTADYMLNNPYRRVVSEQSAESKALPTRAYHREHYGPRTTDYYKLRSDL